MNCIVLLFLLGCCGGWGNRSGCGTGNCGCGCGNDCCGNDRDRGRRDGCCGNGRDVRGLPCDRGTPGRGRDCGCMEEHRHEHDDCGCAADVRESCEVPGMIPPPWQEYPGFHHRDGGEDCEA